MTMNHFIGMDLGTTNSVICSFDGQETRVWKSPEQNDVTPSAIYEDRHGHRFYGRRAYELAPFDEKNAATLFKRYLGTVMKFTFERSGAVLTPEECSAEILRLMYGYLPAEWQGSPDTAVVITVPAAFNQMKKDATLKAAELARLGSVALMQEPVAAVMSAMKEKKIDGVFLVYDLGGGTFDVSVASHEGGRVNILAQGGKEMCGGRDWDRLLWRQTVLPWLREHFHLPDDVERSPDFRRLRQLALFACEQAKIELSLRQEAYVQMDEGQIGQKDLDGNEIYLDVRLTRDMLTGFIRELIATTVDVSRQIIMKAGVTAGEIRKIVFIGGPTQYPPLQEIVMRSLGILEKGPANPMTAVAEGAAVFGESVDWSTELHNRLETIGRAKENEFEIRYEQRVSDPKARVGFRHAAGADFYAELTARADGWTSGLVRISGQGTVEVPLNAGSENVFALRLFDAQKQPVELQNDTVVISRVLATVDAIPASHSIALKVLDKAGGHPVPVYVVRENERLPKRGTILLRAGKRLVAGSREALVFTLWEGDIPDPIEDNRYIGTYRIPGTSFTSGVIDTGAEIICEYEVSESGALRLGVAVPSVGAVFANQNFYSSDEGKVDLSDTSSYLRTANTLKGRVLEMQAGGWTPEFLSLLSRLDKIIRGLQDEDPETVQQTVDDLVDCRKTVARFRHDNIKTAYLARLDGHMRTMDMYRDELRPQDTEKLDALYDEARRAIDHNGSEFETLLHEFRVSVWQALVHSDRYLRDQFELRIRRPSDYTNAEEFNRIQAMGQQIIEGGNIRALLPLIGMLGKIEKPDEPAGSEKMFDEVNVTRG